MLTWEKVLYNIIYIIELSLNENAKQIDKICQQTTVRCGGHLLSQLLWKQHIHDYLKCIEKYYTWILMVLTVANWCF